MSSQCLAKRGNLCRQRAAPAWPASTTDHPAAPARSPWAHSGCAPRSPWPPGPRAAPAFPRAPWPRSRPGSCRASARAGENSCRGSACNRPPRSSSAPRPAALHGSRSAPRTGGSDRKRTSISSYPLAFQGRKSTLSGYIGTDRSQEGGCLFCLVVCHVLRSDMVRVIFAPKILPEARSSAPTGPCPLLDDLVAHGRSTEHGDEAPRLMCPLFPRFTTTPRLAQNSADRIRKSGTTEWLEPSIYAVRLLPGTLAAVRLGAPSMRLTHQGVIVRQVSASMSRSCRSRLP